VVSQGNGIPCLQDELADHGITLSEEFREAEKDMGISPAPPALMSEGSLRIMRASRELGVDMVPMPKFIDFSKCSGCGECTDGCAKGAKWTALDYLREAIEAGAEVMYNSRVEQVVVVGGRAIGVRVANTSGQADIRAQVVVLAAGALETPVILQRSGIAEAGSGLFADLAVDLYGLTKDTSHTDGLPTPLIGAGFHRSKGFILTPYVSPSRRTRLTTSGLKAAAMPTRRLIGIMTKIADDANGCVRPDGTVRKPVTAADKIRLREGLSTARRILLEAGALGRTLVTTRPRGGHPGGSAAIGRIVDRDLQTSVDGLFACDASVLPKAPGLPPILTIVALAKHLARILA